jgi:hypothetical protein
LKISELNLSFRKHLPVDLFCCHKQDNPNHEGYLKEVFLGNLK